MVKRLALPAAIVTLALGCGRRDKVLATNQSDAHLLGAANGRVHWVSDRMLHWYQEGFDEPRTFAAVGADWMKPGNVAFDARGIYYVHHNRLQYLELVPGPSSANNTEVGGWEKTAGEHPSGVALDDQCIYALHVDVECRGRGAIAGWPRTNGAACSRRDVPANGLQSGEFRLDAERFYWVNTACPSRFSSSNEGVKAFSRSSGQVIDVALLEPSVPRDLQVGNKGLYWRTTAGIRFSPKAPIGQPTTLVAGEVDDLLVDHGTVFYVTDGGLYWQTEDVGQPTRLADTHLVREIAVDERFLYWLSADGVLTRSRRPD